MIAGFLKNQQVGLASSIGKPDHLCLPPVRLGIGVGRSTSPPPTAPLAAEGPPKEAEMVLDATEAQEERGDELLCLHQIGA